MSTYSTYAIWGAGTLGARIATELLELKASVIILTRPVSHFSLCYSISHAYVVCRSL
jgi:Trk K+ transport system NAD-binding subunit